METLKDFFSDLKDRISNPFISSFVLSWLIFNYQIVIPLLLYSQSDLQRDGYTSYMNLIFHCYSEENMLWRPLKFAFVYTFGFSIFKSVIEIFKSWLLSVTNTYIYRLTKTSTVTVEYHQEHLSTLEDEKKGYAKLAQNGKRMQSENESLNSQLLSLRDEINTMEARQKEVNDAHDATIARINADNDQRIIGLQVQENERIEEIQRYSLINYDGLLTEKATLQQAYNDLLIQFKEMETKYSIRSGTEK